MTFECDGSKWDTAEMLEFKTPDPEVTVYADSKLRAVFVGIRERDVGVLFHRADNSEVESLCRRYDLPQLLLDYCTNHDASGGCDT